VSWVHGSPIGIATSDDGGATWKYLRNANIIYKDAVDIANNTLTVDRNAPTMINLRPPQTSKID
jgi:hypothetical protein